MKTSVVCLLTFIVSAFWASQVATAQGTGREGPGPAAPKIKGDLNAARPFWDKGGKAYAQGKYDEAAKQFEEAFKRYQHGKFLYAVAQSQRAGGKHNQAVASFKRYLKVHTAPITLAHFNMGDCLLKLKKRQEAEKAFRTFIRLSPNSPFVGQAKLAIKTGVPPSDRDKRDPKTVQQATARTNAGIALYNQNKHAEAARLFLRGYKQFPTMPEFLYNAGLSYERAQSWKEAAKAYEQYVKTPGANDRAWAFLARCRAESFDFPGAYKAYDQYLRISPDGAKYRTEAREFVDDLNPDKPPSPSDAKRARALIQQGKGHYNAGAYEKAIKCFFDAALAAPSRSIFHNIGVCEEKLKHWKLALGSWESYLEPGDKGRHAVGHLHAARCLIELKVPKRALEHVQAYIKRANEADLPWEKEDLAWARKLERLCKERGASGGSGLAPALDTHCVLAAKTAADLYDAKERFSLIETEREIQP